MSDATMIRNLKIGIIAQNSKRAQMVREHRPVKDIYFVTAIVQAMTELLEELEAKHR